MHFRKSRVARSDYVFMFGDHTMECVESYKYLGVLLTDSLDFSRTADVLSNSAGRALGAIIAKYKCMNGMGADTYKKLFVSCVLPVLHYSAGVWGFKQYAKCDNIQNKAMRIFLGVHRFAPVLALHGDMGWFPSVMHRRLDMLRMWNRLIQMDDDRLTRHIFAWDYQLSRKNWCTEVSQIFHDLNMSDVFEQQRPCDVNEAEERYRVLLNNEWSRDVNMKPKLRNYRVVKESIECEPYVSMNLDRTDRSFIAQYRMGILPLAVETGRFRNVPLDERKCLVCNSGVKHEEHFLDVCNAYIVPRENLYDQFTTLLPHFGQLSVVDKLKCMYRGPRKLAKYIKIAFNIRKNILYR